MGRPERALDPQSGPVQRFAHELRKLREKAGSPGYRQLSRRAHFSSTALSEAAGGTQLPSLAVTLGYVEACEGDIAHWEQQWREVAAEVLAPAQDETAPYLGLAAFQAGDAELFRGRESLVADLVDKLGRLRFLGVFGPSGSGKSSLLRAGLVPAVPWRSVVLTPTAHPLRELAAKTADQPELVVVDQFEELFTLCADEGERVGFVTALLKSDARVVVGGRIDFLGQCAAIPALVSALNDSQVLVGPMNADELRRAIEEPAAAAGLKAEPEMVAAALTDAHGRPGALPLLSHALLETWRRRERGRLTLAGYQASGGVTGAIAATAEHTFTELGLSGQTAARGVLLRLVHSGHSEYDLRRRVALAEVLAAGDPGETSKALNSLTAARLVVVADGSVELAHEALTRAWPRLRAWIEEDRERLEQHRDFTTAALAWEAVDKDPGALYRGVRLAAAGGLADAADWQVLSTELEREFLSASLAQETAERAASRRQARRLSRLVQALAVLLVACMVIAIVAVLQRRSAVDEQHIAQSRQLALQAQDLSEAWPDSAEVLAVSAFRTAPTAEARGALLSTAAYKPPRALLRDHRGAVRAVAFSRDGKLLASAGNDRSVQVRNPFDGSPPVVLTQHSDTVRALAFHPTAPLLASAGDDQHIVLWDTNTRAPAHVLSVPHGRVNSLTFSEDGQWFASASQDGTVIIWDPAGRELSRISHGIGEVNDVAISGNLVALAGREGVFLHDRALETGQTFRDHGGAVLTVALSRSSLASGGADTQVVLRDLSGGAPSFLRRHTAGIRSVEYSPDGGKLMSAADDGSVRWWSVPDSGWLTGLISRTGAFFAAGLSSDGRHLAAAGDESVSVWEVALPPFTGHVVPPFSVAMAPDGRVASGGADHSIMLWDPSGLRQSVLTTPATVKSLAFHPNGTLLSAGEDGAVTVWDLAAGKPVRAIPGHTGPITGFAVTGNLAASGGADHTIRLFDPISSVPARILPTAHAAAVEALAFSPDTKMLASGGADGRIILWDTENSRQVSMLGELGNAIRDVAFTPDGTLITGDAAGTIKLWDTQAHREKATLPGQRGAVREIAISDDGKLLAVAGSDTVITLWDTTTHEQIAGLTGHSGPTNAIAFGPGNQLASTGADPRVIRWDLDPAAVMARICARNSCP